MMGLQEQAQNITPEAFRPRAPRDETVRIHPCGLWQPPPNLAAGIQSLSFNRSRWHPAASLRPDHPLNVAPGGAAVRWRTPYEGSEGGSFTMLANAEAETFIFRIFCSLLL